MLHKIYDILDDIEKHLKLIRRSAEELDGRRTEVKHIRTCIFSILDKINKLERMLEMFIDEEK